MSSYLKKGIAVWMLGFMAFLSSLNAFNAVLLWTLAGEDIEFEPYLIGQFTGRIQVATYLWASLTLAFVLFGCTAVMAFRKPPLDPDLVEILAVMDNNVSTSGKALEASIEANRKSINDAEANLREELEAQRTANEKAFEAINSSLQSVKTETTDFLGRQEREFRKLRRELTLIIETGIGDVREEVLDTLAKQDEAIKRMERLTKRSARTMEKGTADLVELKARLETLENALTVPQPKLTSKSSTRDIKGIGPRLAEELKAIGITNVDDFLSADPALIEGKTRLTRDTTERLQGTAQLLMIPGIDKTDVELLEKAGVTKRKELAEQDPFELHRKLSGIARTYVEQGKISEAEKPTVEEILSWVKLAK